MDEEDEEDEEDEDDEEDDKARVTAPAHLVLINLVASVCLGVKRLMVPGRRNAIDGVMRRSFMNEPEKEGCVWRFFWVGSGRLLFVFDDNHKIPTSNPHAHQKAEIRCR